MIKYEKVCKFCGETKLYNEFNSCLSNSTGRKTTCRDCEKKIKKSNPSELELIRKNLGVTNDKYRFNPYPKTPNRSSNNSGNNY